jgi:excinuclease UvrABC nuclease subunit
MLSSGQEKAASSTTKELGSIASAHKDLERELEEACEAEDFERAKRISDSIAALEKENDRLLMALHDA